MSEPDPSVTQLLAFVDEAFDRQAWHGPTLRGSLRGVTENQAAWRPAPGRHNIWEVALHAAYWKHVVRGRLLGSRTAFGERGRNWFVRPAPDRRWPEDVRRLVEAHRQLRDVIASLSPRDLRRQVGGHPLAYTVRGIAAHDLYHAGQIQLLKRLGRRAKGRSEGVKG
ncbi:MAG: DinB family protein [Betaproteobacteria bacterium]